MHYTDSSSTIFRGIDNGTMVGGLRDHDQEQEPRVQFQWVYIEWWKLESTWF